MNRSILIVICDFLLVSLLLFSTPDLSKLPDESHESGPQPVVATNAPSSGQDLAAVMRAALSEEQQKREQMLRELEKTRQTTAQQQAQLSESEKKIQHFQQELQSHEQQTQQLQKQQSNLQQQFAAAQTNIEALNRQLHTSTTEATISKEQLAAMQANMQQQIDQAALLKQRLAELEKTNQTVLTQKEKLANQLQLAEVEKRHATEQATQALQQVAVERQEKVQLVQQNTQLAEGVKVLAKKSGDLAQEIRVSRPLAPNTIYSEFLTNRVEAEFTGTRPDFFGGEATARKAAETVLVAEGTNTFALCHVQDTPLKFGSPGTDWQTLTGTLRHGARQVALHSISFCWPDPRMVLIPVSAADARQLGTKVYQFSSDPFKFQDAVLVGAEEGYYGECSFQIDSKNPDYVKLDRSVLKGMFGKFNPSRGDLVFSRTGELMGIMANNTYCMMIHKFDTAATVHLGLNVTDEHTGNTLASLSGFVSGLPPELQ
ncbi:MAG TPA: hypothetical protein VKA67_08495 [Verrucomicrobiae bacterium]|nr:hypothetical protein [Verrucomicrobiae bacterium]